MNDYDLADSGQRTNFESGAMRETEGKLRYDLIPAECLRRSAINLTKGAEKYGPDNWRKGMSTSVFMAALLRHIQAYRLGDRNEDHLAAALFNIYGLMLFEDTEWDDLNG